MYCDPYGGNHDESSNDLTRKRIAGLIQEAAKANALAGSNIRKIANLYHSYMDEATIEAKGLAPLRPHLDAIAAIRGRPAADAVLPNIAGLRRRDQGRRRNSGFLI